MALFIRTAGIPQSLIEPVKLAIWSVDSRQPVHDIDLLSRIISRSVTVPRLVLILTGVVAVLALVLSGIGVYSLMSYAVNQRTREMSIRMAFGAGRGDVLRHVIGSAFRLALAAVAVGLVSAWLIVRAASALLFGMASGYATTFAAAGMLVLVVALGATYLPAKRATLVDPVSSLRAE
jgi:putative ABC transport system permease protein